MDLTPIAIGIPLSVAIIVAALLLASRGNKNFAVKRNREVSKARQTGGAARARIIDLRCAEVQRFRRQNLTTFKFLLEVFPSDSQPVFTASVVWELEPAAINALPIGATVPVIFDRANLRKVFPETAGAHYFQENQHAFLGIENEFKPEEIVAFERTRKARNELLSNHELAAYAPAPNTIYRKRSETKIFGLPLWEVAFNLINKKGRTRYVKSAKARAIFAIGDSATGFIAIGNSARGLIAVGKFSVGLISFGIFSIGILAVGIFGLGLLSLGIFGGGLLTVGAAFGGGYVVIGLLPFYAKYEFGKDFQSPELLAVYENLKVWSGIGDAQFEQIAAAAFITFLIISGAFFIALFVAQHLAIQMLEPNDNRLESPTE